ncbi:MAG: hypothetical protein V3U06_01900 [Candidatus Binatia bacterium]
MKVSLSSATLLLILTVFYGCAPQVRQSPASQAQIQEEQEREREKNRLPTIEHRPGRGLTISGDQSY